MSQSASAHWAQFFGPGFWSGCEFSHISRLLKRGRVGMSEQSGRQGEYVAGDRPEGGSSPPAPPVKPGVSPGFKQFQTVSNPQETLRSQPWVLDLVKMGLAAAFAVGVTYSTMRDGIATGRRGFEIALENRAAIASNKAFMEAGFHGVKVSFGKSINEAIAPVVSGTEATSRAVAVLTEAQKRFESEMRRIIERMRDDRNTP